MSASASPQIDMKPKLETFLRALATLNCEEAAPVCCERCGGAIQFEPWVGLAGEGFWVKCPCGLYRDVLRGR